MLRRFGGLVTENFLNFAGGIAATFPSRGWSVAG